MAKAKARAEAEVTIIGTMKSSRSRQKSIPSSPWAVPINFYLSIVYKLIIIFCWSLWQCFNFVCNVFPFQFQLVLQYKSLNFWFHNIGKGAAGQMTMPKVAKELKKIIDIIAIIHFDAFTAAKIKFLSLFLNFALWNLKLSQCMKC